MNKPEVHYMGYLSIREWPRADNNSPIVYVGHLPEVLNHPRLGKCFDVRTSDILVFPDAQGNFETRNTKYIRVYMPEPLTGLSNESN